MTNPMNPNKIYQFSATFSDPDELNQVAVSEHAPMCFEPQGSGIGFDYKVKATRLGELLVASCVNERKFKSRYTGESPDMLVINFIDTGRHEYKTTRGKSIEVNRGQSYIHRSRDFCSTEVDQATIQTSLFLPFSQYAALVATDVDDPVDELQSLSTVIDMALPQSKILREISNILSSENTSANPLHAAPLGAALLKEAFLEVLIATWPRLSGCETSRYSPSPRHVKRATEWIHAHLADRISLEDISIAAGASVRTIQIGFQKQFGMSPVAYITKCRLKMVHRELLTAPPGRSVKEIAGAWGFFNLGDFAAKYKRSYGILPSETKRAP